MARILPFTGPYVPVAHSIRKHKLKARQIMGELPASFARADDNFLGTASWSKTEVRIGSAVVKLVYIQCSNLASDAWRFS